MARTFVLDTCVLIADPNSLHRFDEHEVVLSAAHQHPDHVQKSQRLGADIGRSGDGEVAGEQRSQRIDHGGRSAVALELIAEVGDGGG